MPSSLYHGTASLSVCEQKVDFPQRKLQEGSTSVPCSVTLHKWPHPWEHQDIGHLLQQHSLSSSAHLLQSDSSQFIEQPLWCDHSWFGSEIWLWLSVQPLSAPFSTLISSVIPLGTLLETKVPATLWQSTLLFLRTFPLEGIAITRQSLLFTIFSSHQCSTIQYSTECHQVQLWNWISIPHQFSGLISMVNHLSSSERRNEKHRKSLPMKASSSSASTHPPPPQWRTLFTQWNPKFLSQNSQDKCFRKAWSTCCRQHTGRENEAPNLK